jgi:uncharacterized protein YdaU (DUF1376 family)
MKDPAFRLYAQDFLMGTMLMSQADVGAYIRLLCWQWDRGSIPKDASALSVIAGGPVSDVVREKFTNLQNTKLEEVRKVAIRFSKKQSRNASKRWHGSGTSQEDTNEHESGTCQTDAVGVGVGVGVGVLDEVKKPLPPSGGSPEGKSSLRSEGRESSGLVNSEGVPLEKIILGVYPRKARDQEKALDAIRLALKKKSPRMIAAITKQYSLIVERWPAGQRRYLNLPENWFEREGYEEDPANWLRYDGEEKPEEGRYDDVVGDADKLIGLIPGFPK